MSVGRVVGFGGRALSMRKRARSTSIRHSRRYSTRADCYLGWIRAERAVRESGTVVIVEGYMDVIQAHQAGKRNVVAQMGTAMTENQIRLVAPRHASKIVLALDSDEAGQSAARRSLEVARQVLRDYAGPVFRLILRILASTCVGKDPDDLLRQSPERMGPFSRQGAGRCRLRY